MRFSLHFLSGGRANETAEFDAEEAISVGRDPSNDCSFAVEDDLAVSAFHARLIPRDGRLWIRDLGSSNGTWLDGTRITEEQEVRSGQVLSFGRNGPRVRANYGIPKTVVETPRTVLETQPTQVPATTAKVQAAGSGMGEGTVLRLIDQAVERARLAAPVVRPTVFAQEIVRIAVRETNRRMLLGLAAMMVLVLGLASWGGWELLRIRKSVGASKAELLGVYQSGLAAVRQDLEANRRDLEERKVLYESSAEELRTELDGILAAAEAQDSGLRRVRTGLSESTARYRELAAELEDLKRREADTREAEQQAASARSRQIEEGLRRERERQAGLVTQLAAAASVSSPAEGDRVRELQAQLVAAETAAGRVGAQEVALASEVAQADADMASRVAAFESGLEGSPEAAVLSAMSDLERLGQEAAAAVPSLPGLVPLGYSPDTSAAEQYTKPYPRANLKKRIAVGRFECLVNNIPWDTGREDVERQMRAMMTTALRESGRFLVVEREDLDEVLLEQKLARTGVVSAQSAAQEGQLLGAQALVIGKITQLAPQREEKRSSMNWGGLINSLGAIAGSFGGSSYTPPPTVSDFTTTTHTVVSSMKVHIDFKVLDTTTGEVVLATQGVGLATSRRKSTAIGTGYGSSASVSLGNEAADDATRQAILHATANILEKMADVPWRGRVMDQHLGQVILNGGEDVGLKIGDMFTVLSRGKVLTDPETGRSRGFIESPGGTVRVARVEADKSFADVVERGLPFKFGDGLAYLGFSRPLRPGEDRDTVAQEDQIGRIVARIARPKPVAYSGPGTSFAEVPLRDLEVGDPLRVKLMVGDWVQVILPGSSKAWMERSAVTTREEKPSGVAELTVTAKRAKIRAQPSEKAKKLATSRPGETLRVRDELGGWYLVEAGGGIQGWVKATDVRAQGQET